MFAYSGLRKEMVEEIRDKHSVYFPLDGRITIPAINKNNIDYLCQAIHSVTKDKEL